MQFLLGDGFLFSEALHSNSVLTSVLSTSVIHSSADATPYS